MELFSKLGDLDSAIHLGLLASEVSVGMPFDLSVHQFPQLSFEIHITLPYWVLVKIKITWNLLFEN